MGVATGCGCKEVYSLILLIPTPLVSVLLQQNPYFLFIFLMLFVLYIYIILWLILTLLLYICNIIL